MHLVTCKLSNHSLNITQVRSQCIRCCWSTSIRINFLDFASTCYRAAFLFSLSHFYYPLWRKKECILSCPEDFPMVGKITALNKYTEIKAKKSSCCTFLFMQYISSVFSQPLLSSLALFYSHLQKTCSSLPHTLAMSQFKMREALPVHGP